MKRKSSLDIRHEFEKMAQVLLDVTYVPPTLMISDYMTDEQIRIMSENILSYYNIDVSEIIRGETLHSLAVYVYKNRHLVRDIVNLFKFD